MSDTTTSEYPTPPPESLCNSPPTPVSGHADSTAYYYISSEGRRVYPDTSSLTPYKPLPERWDESEHYWLYGWPVSDRKLQALLPKYFGIRKSSNGMVGAMYAWSNLERVSGYWHLSWYICKATEETQKEGLVEDISGLGVRFLMLSCTAGSRFFERRPTVKQLKCLTGILGEPRWLESQQTKEKFSFEYIR